MLASTSNAIVVGFNVRPDSAAKAMAERTPVDMRMYRVIYSFMAEIEPAMKGMLAPKYKEVELGTVEVRKVYKISNVGVVAGCYVTEGKVTRSAQLRLVRDGIVIHEGEIASLQRFKDSVKEVTSGYECGITLEKFSDIKPGDRFTAVFTGYGPSQNGMQPPKVMEYTIEHQSLADMAMSQPQPVMQQPAQSAQQGFVDPWSGRPMQPAQPAPAPQPVTIPTQQPQSSQPRVDAQQILQLKALGKPPQEIAGMLGLSVEQVTAVTDQANPGMHGGEDASEAF